MLLYGANLSAITGVTLQPTGTLTGDGRISGHLTNLGTVQADNLSVSETFVNAGLINGSGYLNATLSNVALGKVRTAAGEHLRVVGGAHSLILSGNSNTTFYDALDVQSGGELRVSNGSAAVFFGQVNQRTGSIFAGTGSKFYEGGLSIGGSPGLGFDAGNVSFGSGNVYLEKIGGLAAGTEFDKYVVAGALSFGGTLNVVWWGGFVGAEGESFDLFDWGSSTGTFSTLDFSAAPLAAGLTWDASKLYLTGEIAISAVPEPESWALLLAGLGIVGSAARRARRQGHGSS